MALGAVVLDGVAPYLTLGREDIGVASEVMQVARLGVSTFISKEILILIVPDVRICEVLSILGVGVKDHRVAGHEVCLVAHLYVVHGDKLMALGVVVAAVRLHVALALLDVAATAEVAHLVGSVEAAVVGVHNGFAINYLDDVGVDCCGACHAVVRGAITIGVGAILVDEHVAEALETAVGVTHGTIGENHGAIVVCCEVTHEDKYRRVALLDKVAVVGYHINHAAVTRGALLGCWELCGSIYLAICRVVVFVGSDAEYADNKHNEEYR